MEGGSRVHVCVSAGHAGFGRELAALRRDGHVDGGAVDLRLVHVFDGGFGVGVVVVEDVCGAAVGSDCVVCSASSVTASIRREQLERERGLTGSVHGEVEVVDGTELAEYLKEMVFVDVLGEPFDHDLYPGIGC